MQLTSRTITDSVSDAVSKAAISVEGPARDAARTVSDAARTVSDAASTLAETVERTAEDASARITSRLRPQPWYRRVPTWVWVVASLGVVAAVVSVVRQRNEADVLDAPWADDEHTADDPQGEAGDDATAEAGDDVTAEAGDEPKADADDDGHDDGGDEHDDGGDGHDDGGDATAESSSDEVATG